MIPFRWKLVICAPISAPLAYWWEGSFWSLLMVFIPIAVLLSILERKLTG